MSGLFMVGVALVISWTLGISLVVLNAPHWTWKVFQIVTLWLGAAWLILLAWTTS